MDHDTRSREIIARAMAGEAMTDGAGGTADPCYWYGPYADVALAALKTAGLLVISTASLVPLDQDNPRPEAFVLNEHVLRLEIELEEANAKIAAVEAFAERCFDTNDGCTPAYGIEIWQALGREVGRDW